MNDKLFLVYPLNKIDLLNKTYLSQECMNELAEEETGLFLFFGILLLKGTFRDLFVTKKRNEKII